VNQGRSNARQIWVSINGSPFGNGSINSPYDITTACQEKVQQGDIVMVKEGTYSIMEEIVITHSGTKENPIIIKSADGKYKAVINILESHDMGFHVEKANYITFDGFKFLQGDRGINIIGWDKDGNHQPCKGIIIRNCTFDGKQGDLIKVLWADDILIENNVFIGAHDEQIDLLGVWGGIVRNNVFRDFPDPYGQTCCQVKGGSKDVIIEKNLFYNVSEKSVSLGSYTDPEYKRPDSNALEGINLTLQNNIFFNCSGTIVMNDCQGAQIYNNTSWSNQLIWKKFILWGRTSDVKICNNIVVASDIGKLVDHQEEEGADRGFEGKNNIFWDGDGSIGWGTIPENRYENTIQLNPLLADPSNGDFHLLKGSPAIDAGITLPSIREDYDGVVRPQGDGIDIGAFEVMEAITQPPPLTLTCYPNPSRGGEEITFKDIKDGSIIKIFSLSGELIKQINKYPWKWDLTNEDNRKVASGTYIYMVIRNNKIETRGKLSIIR